MTIDFKGRVAIVTGAGGGLGRQHALALAARGAKVLVNDLGGARDGSGGSVSAAEAVVAEIKAAGGEAMGARSCAALMLAHVVRGSGPHEERARDEIRALFEELGESVLEILGELGPAGQAAIAFVCVRVGFAEDMIVQRVKPEEMRARIRAGELPRSVYVDILG